MIVVRGLKKTATNYSFNVNILKYYVGHNEIDLLKYIYMGWAHQLYTAILQIQRNLCEFTKNIVICMEVERLCKRMQKLE